jgi:nicotinamide-nucleotide amidase
MSIRPATSASRGSLRAGILITGTEVLAGLITDRNGPWLAERLRELGVDLVQVTIVGDRPAEMLAALRSMADQGLHLVLTTGGLGPTADDLTATVVGELQVREMVLDATLEGRIAEILRPLAERWPDLDMQAIRESNRKQAVIPAGATILGPVGTAPGLVVPPRENLEGPTVVVLPGPPRELQAMWPEALATAPVRAVLAAAREYRRTILRLYGLPESEIAETLRAAERARVPLERLEITTCLRRGEIEIVTSYEPDAASANEAFVAFVAERHPDTLFSTDGSTVDEQVADLLRRGAQLEGHLLAAAQPPSARTIATAESCTGGLLGGRLTDLPGSSDYMLGGLVVYSDEAKVSLAGVPPELIERHGAVSAEVARALADGARRAFGADVGVGITGIAGPGGGTPEKPVGLVWLSVSEASGACITRSVRLPGSRADVRERATTVAMHLIRRLLTGDPHAEGSLNPAPEGVLNRGA